MILSAPTRAVRRRCDARSAAPSSTLSIAISWWIAATQPRSDDKDDNKFVVTRRFRVAAVLPDVPGSGWLLELPSATIEGYQTAEEAVRRSARAESGVEIVSLQHIATILPSPGVSSERVFLFYSDDVQPAAATGPADGVAVEKVSPETLFERLDRHEINDAKLLVAAQWLRRKLPATPGDVVLSAGLDRSVRSSSSRRRRTPRLSLQAILVRF